MLSPPRGPMPLETARRRAGAVAVLEVRGTLDAVTADAFAGELLRHVRQAGGDLVVDLRTVGRPDARLLAALRDAGRVAGCLGRRLAVRADDPTLLHMLVIAALDREIVVRMTLEDALAELG